MYICTYTQTLLTQKKGKMEWSQPATWFNHPALGKKLQNSRIIYINF